MTTQMTWDEPAGAASPRGWLHRADGNVIGFYLDYGPDHYRSPHEYCQPGRPCPDCQPGNVLAVRYPRGPGTSPRGSRYVETIEQARGYVETGDAAERPADVMTARTADPAPQWGGSAPTMVIVRSGGFLPRCQVKQYVARVRGEFSVFDVYTTGDAQYYWFAQLDRTETYQTGLAWPVAKARLRDDIRSALANGWGHAPKGR